jgi:hypothetical protein
MFPTSWRLSNKDKLYKAQLQYAGMDGYRGTRILLDVR